jgi:hypothetical protein
MRCQLLPENAKEGDIIDIRINKGEAKRWLDGIREKKRTTSPIN